MKLDKRKKLVLAGLLVFIVFMILMMLSTVFHREQPVEASQVGTIPEADLRKEDDSKTGSYRKGGIGDYWDSLEASEDPSLDVVGDDASGSTAAEREKPRPVGVDDLFGKNKGNSSQAGGRRGPSGTGDPGGKPEEPRPATSSQKAPTAEAGLTEAVPAEEPDRPSTEQPLQVKRSGAVSSLDEDVTAQLGSGFSTLDGTESWIGSEKGKPYRCMFTRDEKIRSGQRVTVRLLEDLVIGGVHIPRNTHLQGVAGVSDRLEISFTTLDMGGRILSFRLEAHDTDGGRGIYCSELGRETKSAAEQGLSTVSSTLNSRLGRVARGAVAVGASIARNKAGEATVSVPAGYTFYIIEKTD